MTDHANSSIFSMLLSGASSFFRVIKNRRQIARLHDLTDVQLEDIGLSRGDVRRALKLPLLQDPTAGLSLMAQQRRMGETAPATRTAPAALSGVEAVTLSIFAPFSQSTSHTVRSPESSLAA
ncbi:DUF1127 domain-containing protein [Roseibium sp. CAU 1637]|uniref:DUF1127 domain-containing protein n=1 Tax=Roseibium limicola TaxID=2816037 RepID=A0A939J756_9HYPH|nr:DUF1127 domain-containing protein [Roseibium limicola]MBO0345817.1 DUF1127 domain-containing protein [Roseibium limicola]